MDEGNARKCISHREPVTAAVEEGWRGSRGRIKQGAGGTGSEREREKQRGRQWKEKERPGKKRGGGEFTQ